MPFINSIFSITIMSSNLVTSQSIGKAHMLVLFKNTELAQGSSLPKHNCFKLPFNIVLESCLEFTLVVIYDTYTWNGICMLSLLPLHVFKIVPRGTAVLMRLSVLRI